MLGSIIIGLLWNHDSINTQPIISDVFQKDLLIEWAVLLARDNFSTKFDPAILTEV